MKKKVYIQPAIELTQLMSSTIILAGSAGGGLGIGSTPIPDSGGGD